MPRRTIITVTTVIAIAAVSVFGQMSVTPTNDAPNPYETVANYFKMPEGRTWGSTSAVDVDKDGKSIWVAERCGANSCLNSNLDIVLKFDASGKLLKSFGSGLMIFPHGMHVDRDGNVWVTDGQDNVPRRAPDAPPATPLPPQPAKLIGHQVFKFSPDGKVLLTLGKPGGNPPGQPADPASLYQPNDVITLANGDVLVAEGHSNAPETSTRIVRFNRDGKYLGQFGKYGSGPGEFIQPHGLAMDAQGRLLVADRSNNRVQILTTEGKFIDEWKQFSRPSGIYVRNDMVYVADSESGSVEPKQSAWRRGIRIGSIGDGKLLFFIPDPETRNAPEVRGTLAAEGVAVDAAGNIYGAEVGPKGVKKYVKKQGTE
jgi:DNA-binding beta-propeller fold protein YncE